MAGKKTCERDPGVEIPSGKKCSDCSGSAVIYLPYAKKYMCRRHFYKHFEKRFLDTVREFRMVRKGNKVALGLSGGKDSTILLHMLHKLKSKLPYELVAITLDLGIECDYNRKIIDIAEAECKKLEVPHHVFKLKEDIGYTLDGIVEKTKTKNPCSDCGVAKRYLLNKHAKEIGADKLAIAHNLNDTAQTVLMNILRNEPMRLLRYNEHLVEDEKLVPRIKPFLRIPEQEIIVYGKLKGFPVLAKKCCPYSSYAFRSFVREEVERTEKEYPGSMFKILNSFLSLQKLYRENSGIKEIKMSYCRKCGEPSGSNICKFCALMERLA